MRENRLSGSEGGGIEFNRFSLPLSGGRNPSPGAFKINRWTPSPGRGYGLPPLRGSFSPRLCRNR